MAKPPLVVTLGFDAISGAPPDPLDFLRLLLRLATGGWIAVDAAVIAGVLVNG
jgi:hypothetical protein